MSFTELEKIIKSLSLMELILIWIVLEIIFTFISKIIDRKFINKKDKSLNTIQKVFFIEFIFYLQEKGLKNKEIYDFIFPYKSYEIARMLIYEFRNFKEEKCNWIADNFKECMNNYKISKTEDSLEKTPTKKEVLKALRILNIFLMSMRVQGYFGTPPQKEEDLELQEIMINKCLEIKAFIESKNQNLSN